MDNGCKNERWWRFLPNRNLIPARRMVLCLRLADETYNAYTYIIECIIEMVPCVSQSNQKQKKKRCRRMNETICVCGEKRNELICSDVRWLDDNVHSMTLLLPQPSSARYACRMRHGVSLHVRFRWARIRLYAYTYHGPLSMHLSFSNLDAFC